MSGVPVYQGYPSQYGHGLGNVLGGIVRAALPIVKTVAKKAGSQLLESGINFVRKKVTKSKPVKRATSRPVRHKRTASRHVHHKRRKPPGKSVRRSTRKKAPRDIFTT